MFSISYMAVDEYLGFVLSILLFICVLPRLRNEHLFCYPLWDLRIEVLLLILLLQVLLLLMLSLISINMFLNDFVI